MKKIAILIGLEHYLKLSRNLSAEIGIKAITSVIKKKYSFSSSDKIIIVNDRYVRREKWSGGNLLEAVLDSLYSKETYDLAIVIYWGYGFIDPCSQKRYIADFYTEPDSLNKTALDLDLFFNWVDGINSPNKLVVLDAGWQEIYQNAKSSVPPVPSVLPYPNATENIAILYSGKAGEQNATLYRSYETVLTAYLRLGLQKRFDTGNELARFVCMQAGRALQQLSSGPQSPSYTVCGTTEVAMTDRALYRRTRQRLCPVHSRLGRIGAFVQIAMFLILALGVILLISFPKQAALLCEKFNYVGTQDNVPILAAAQSESESQSSPEENAPSTISESAAPASSSDLYEVNTESAPDESLVSEDSSFFSSEAQTGTVAQTEADTKNEAKGTNHVAAPSGDVKSLNQSESTEPGVTPESSPESSPAANPKSTSDSPLVSIPNTVPNTASNTVPSSGDSRNDNLSIADAETNGSQKTATEPTESNPATGQSSSNGWQRERRDQTPQNSPSQPETTLPADASDQKPEIAQNSGNQFPAIVLGPVITDPAGPFGDDSTNNIADDNMSKSEQMRKTATPPSAPIPSEARPPELSRPAQEDNFHWIEPARGKSPAPRPQPVPRMPRSYPGTNLYGYQQGY